MADAAAQIRQTRAGYVERLGRLSVPFLDELSDGRERIGVRYLSDVGEEIDEPSAVRAEYRRVFTENIERERGAGTSLYGVQRDDLAISVNGVSVRDYGSQGQQRSAVLALKLAEGEATREITGEHPVFLFDDVMSELDERRRSFLLTAAKGRQTIMTSCELREDLLGSLSGAVRLFHVCGGEYERR